MSAPIVAVAMGSDSDLPVMGTATATLHELGIAHETRVLSAHRTPRDMLEYADGASRRGLRVIIAGAGGAAHLPGMLAAATILPVIGVPIALEELSGLDSLLSIAQMPSGTPVATMAINGAQNAALLAARILATGDRRLGDVLRDRQESLATRAREQDKLLGDRLPLSRQAPPC